MNLLALVPGESALPGQKHPVAWVENGVQAGMLGAVGTWLLDS